MGVHDDYGKRLFRSIAKEHFIDVGPAVEVQYQGTVARVDGVIREFCAIEIESRTDKQIRGALIDLLLHPLPRKLLVIVPAHMNAPSATVAQCEFILSKLKAPISQPRLRC